MRVAAWGAEMGRDGPGLLLRDLLRGEDGGVVAGLAAAAPDVVLLTDVDWDADGAALAALRDVLREAGLDYPHALAPRPNAGMATNLDLDGDGRLGTPDDAQGWGRFAGEGGMAVLSRWPLALTADLSALAWADLPGNRAPPGTHPAQRLSSSGHWVVLAETPEGPLTLLAWDATPPVFDGPEDRNGRRNADELALWRLVLDGEVAGVGPVAAPFVLLGNANLDPERGEGLRDEMAALLADPRVADPLPGVPTGLWPDPPEGPGPLRVSYVLPSADLRVTGAGVEAPPEGVHALVWVDVAR